jgi:hypothetical protein
VGSTAAACASTVAAALLCRQLVYVWLLVSVKNAEHGLPPLLVLLLLLLLWHHVKLRLPPSPLFRSVPFRHVTTIIVTVARMQLQLGTCLSPLFSIRSRLEFLRLPPLSRGRLSIARVLDEVQDIFLAGQGVHCDWEWNGELSTAPGAGKP